MHELKVHEKTSLVMTYSQAGFERLRVTREWTNLDAIRRYEPLGNVKNQIYFLSSRDKVNSQYGAPNILSDI
jgi:hypothetical protein